MKMIRASRGRFGIILSTLLLACNTGGGSGGDGTPRDGEAVPQDDVIAQKADALGDFTIDRILSYGFDDIGNVFYSVSLLYADGQRIGQGFARWTPTSNELLLTPT